MLSIFLLLRLLAGTQIPLPTPVFEAETIDANISIGYGIAIGDVDGDGKPDILLADKKQFAWYRNGDWKRFVMAENLTEFDNVCIAARDLDGDGKVEVAVGAQWNPGETSDTAKSGSVHYLIRPQDVTQKWQPVKLYHEPTVHRMQWVRSARENFLVVVPLHGKGNKNGEGKGVQIIAYKLPNDPYQQWDRTIIDSNMHLTHNLFIQKANAQKDAGVLIAGKEGVRSIDWLTEGNKGKATVAETQFAAGEVRVGTIKTGEQFLATIEPMHGSSVVVYSPGQHSRIVLDAGLKEGHALATADFLGLGFDQVVAGWRSPNKENKTGIKMFVPNDNTLQEWQTYWVDENEMATEDLQVSDLNGDGKPDIIAAGRATKNLKIYWNKSK